jgi:hypothetical protein
MDRRGPLLPIALLIALLLVGTLAACGRGTRATFIPDGGSYTADDLQSALENADLTAFEDVSAEKAPDIRQKVLATLRQEGADAAALADTLTAEFPEDALAVPAVVERATYEGAPAWIVIESWGEAGGTLVHRRLWVLSYNERTVIAAQSAL